MRHARLKRFAKELFAPPEKPGQSPFFPVKLSFSMRQGLAQNESSTSAHWHVAYSPEEKIVQAKGYGPMTLALLTPMVSQALTIAAQTGVNRFLYDHQEATFIGSTMQIYELPRILSELGFSRAARVALLAPPGGPSQKDLDFFSTRMFNCGYQARLFAERSEALHWLQERVPGPSVYHSRAPQVL
jgi:hypothetical protein